MASSTTTNKAPARLAPRTPFYVKAQAFVYRLTGGKLLGRALGMKFLILTTTGRKSGNRYAVLLSYFQTGDTHFIVASNYGGEHYPAWYFNFLAQPQIEVELGNKRYTGTAAVASPEERARLWPDLIKDHPIYARYQRKTSREIHLVLLHLDT